MHLLIGYVTSKYDDGRLTTVGEARFLEQTCANKQNENDNERIKKTIKDDNDYEDDEDEACGEGWSDEEGEISLGYGISYSLKRRR